MAKRKTITRELTIADALSEAFSELTSLSEEMREWADNMSSNNMEHLPKFEEVSESADNLEQLREVEVPPDLEDIGELKVSVTFPDTKKHRMQGRAGRRDDAVYTLQVAVEALDGKLAELDEKKELTDDEQSRKQEIESLNDEIQNLIDEAEAVDFPGMY